MNRKGFILSTYVYMLLVFFLLLLTTMLAVMNNTKLLSNKLKEQSGNTSGLIDKDYSFILLGEKDMVLRKGEEYVEPGFKIQTAKKKDLNDIVKINGSVDVNSPNTYKLTYSATYNGITKKLIRNVIVLDSIVSNYITGLYKYRKDENNLINPKVTYESTEYDTGIRYSGTNPNNYVYFNCDDKDSNNVSYGEEDYNYKSGCEVWRIIGLFDASNGITTEKKVKLINTASTFTASWDSSASDINYGYGINQWGESGSYEGADLMRLLNGYYIGKSGSECKYCTGGSQATYNETCTSESLKTANMKVLTNTGKAVIENVIWDTYGVISDLEPVTPSNIGTIYLQERGISEKYSGKLCSYSSSCSDSVARTTSWDGLVGLMSISDSAYANGWLYNLLEPWSITPYTSNQFSYNVWRPIKVIGYSWAKAYIGVWPSVYLRSTVRITSGDGTQEKPYKLSM